MGLDNVQVLKVVAKSKEAVLKPRQDAGRQAQPTANSQQSAVKPARRVPDVHPLPPAWGGGYNQSPMPDVDRTHMDGTVAVAEDIADARRLDSLIEMRIV